MKQTPLQCRHVQVQHGPLQSRYVYVKHMPLQCRHIQMQHSSLQCRQPRSSTGLCSVDTSIISKQQRFDIPKKMLAQALAQPAQTFFQRRLSRRRQFFSAGSACVDIFLAQAQPAQANCQRRLSLRKFFPCFDSFFQRRLSLRRHFFKRRLSLCRLFFQRRLSLCRQFFNAGSACAKNTKRRISPVVFAKIKKFSSPQVTYPYRVYKWIENLTLGHL